MNAKELIDKLSANPTSPLDLAATSAAALPIILRALRLLAAAEGGGVALERTEEEWANPAIYISRLERERTDLAARVAELEKDAERYRWLEKYATQYWGGTVGTLPHWYFRGHPYNTLVGYSLSEAIDDARSQP